MTQDLDLLGDPIPENWGKRGRPPHIPTAENRNKVIVLLAFEWGEDRIAAALGITQPTLRKHYFRELKVRVEARARLEAQLLYGMTGKALGGDVPAYREIRKVIERADQRQQHAGFAGVAPSATQARPPVSQPKLGKKEERRAAAEQISGLFSPGPAPAKVAKH